MVSVNHLSKIARLWQQISPEIKAAARSVICLPEGKKLVWVDLSAANPELAQLDIVDASAINAYIQQLIQNSGAAGAIGGYMENRLLYLRSNVFAGTEHRTLHLGVDIWLPAGTPIYAMLEGKIHSFADNANFGDYGPTIILEHNYQYTSFYTLYGHLCRPSLAPLYEGMPVAAGAQIGTLGGEAENGNWPPHLHFQLILDLEGRKGDFPGVAAPSHQAYFEQLCPDPNDLLGFQQV